MKRAPIKTDLTAEKVCSLFTYDALTGHLFHKEKHGAVTGARAGHVGKSSGGYCVLTIHQRPFYAHRIVWLIVTGNWPKLYLGHINGDNPDNRFANLREATQHQNMSNSSRKKKDKLKGAYRHGNRWRTIVRESGKNVIIGNFGTEQEAHDAYWQAAQRVYGEFARAT